MNQFSRRALLSSAIVVLAMTQGCATHVKATSAQNPPPKEVFAGFGRIELKPTTFKPGLDGNVQALGRLEANIKLNLAKSLPEWNSRPDNGRTLIIEPIVEDMQFKSTGSRIFLGPLAGSSGILLRMKFTDAKTGELVAHPQFFQRADAMSGGFALGILDATMLTRVASMASSYVIGNFNAAVGGPTGADDQNIAAK